MDLDAQRVGGLVQTFPKSGKAISTRIGDMDETDRMPGEVKIAVDYSTMNYKDALAVIDSVNRPREVRLQAWSRLTGDLDLGELARMTEAIAIADVPALAGRTLEGQIRGRTGVDVNA